MHMVAHGILANNEWREGWLDEGLASFLSNWFRESRGEDPEQVWGRTRDLVARWTPAAAPSPWGSRRRVQQLRHVPGHDVHEGVADLPHAPGHAGRGHVSGPGSAVYYQRFRFRQVTAGDFQNVMEEVSGQDLEWFFRQWLHTTHVLDFRVGNVRLTGQTGGYTLVADVVREGQAWMPLIVEAGGQRQRLESRERVQQVRFRLDEPVETVILDPDGILPLVRRAR
jgi:hypothetical protein